MVCSAADSHSLAQIRLAHIPEYTDIALQQMVRHIHLVCHYRSFDRFYEIAQQSLERRSYVRTITYEMDYLQNLRIVLSGSGMYMMIAYSYQSHRSHQEIAPAAIKNSTTDKWRSFPLNDAIDIQQINSRLAGPNTRHFTNQ